MINITPPKSVAIFSKGEKEVAIARLGSRLVNLRQQRREKNSKMVREAIVDVLAELVQLGAELDEKGWIRTL